MKRKVTDPQTYALILSSAVASDIASLLPETDLCDELRTILYMHHDLITVFAEKKRVSSHHLKVFINYLEHKMDEVLQMNIEEVHE